MDSSAPQREAMPEHLAPMLASPGRLPGEQGEWAFELKWDGVRALLYWRPGHPGSMRMESRNRKEIGARYPELHALGRQLGRHEVVLDGEIVAFDERGLPSFARLQKRMHLTSESAVARAAHEIPITYAIFDLLYLDGRSTIELPYRQRRELLEGLRLKGPAWQVPAQRVDGGAELLAATAEHRLEGVIAKRLDSPYRPGERSGEWVKIKNVHRQELVIGGWLPGKEGRSGQLGALLVGYHEHDASHGLRYAGRVGTGYTRKTARELWQRLKSLKIDKPPLTLPQGERRKDVIWVKPQLVIEAEYRGVTHGDVLRQASFKGLREDKPAREVVREVPVAAMAQRQAVRKSAKTKSRGKSPAKSPAKTQSAKPAPARAKASARSRADVGNVHLTHPDRVYWVDVGVTKEDLAEYYVSVWDWMAPHVVDRPLALVRCPGGTKGQCFFQKHIAENVKDSPLRHAVDAKEHDVIAVEKLDDVVALVQSGTLEIHTRGSRLQKLESCDRIVFDLDPGDGVSWKEIVTAAREVRERLEAVKLKSFAKLSGGKGIHVVVPIDGADWDTTKNFSQKIALGLAADSPQRYVGKMTKALRKGKIFIDYFRNSREATSVAPYSTRARPGAAVSAPLSWDDLGRTKSAADFTVLNLKRHFRSDPWADIGKVRQKLPAK